jgi:hypothetical protein
MIELDNFDKAMICGILACLCALGLLSVLLRAYG